MARVLVALVLLFALGLPVLAQDSAGAEQAKRIKELVQQLGDEDAGSSLGAAERLGAVGPPAVPALVVALSNENKNLRVGAAIALTKIGLEAVPALIVALSDEEQRTRVLAASALINIGPKAVPALVSSLSSSDKMVRVAAVSALAKIGPKAVPALIAALSDEDEQVRLHANLTVTRIGSKAVPGLIAALSAENKNVRTLASVALGKIGVSLKARGTLLWWVVPRAYRREIVALLLLLVAWFAYAGRVRHRRPYSKLVLTAVTAAIPSALACTAVGYAVTRNWAQGFLPEAVTLVPFPVAAVLSTAFVCILTAVGVCWRKQPAAPEASAG